MEEEYAIWGTGRKKKASSNNLLLFDRIHF